jgi:hypothetical protein
MLPIYWISYHYSKDLDRSRSFKKRYERLSKSFPGKSHCLNIYESSSNPKDFKGNGIPATKESMIITAHCEVIQRARKQNYTEVLIIEDKTTFVNQIDFKDFLINFKPPFTKWTILFLGGYIEDHQLHACDKEWVSGRSRSHFAYIINLKSNLNLCMSPDQSLDEDFVKQLYNSKNTYYRQPFLIVPQYYNYKKGLMDSTARGLPMAQIEESSDLTELKLKMEFIEEDKLPVITLLTVLDNSRSWWPLISMNLNNLEYVTQKMEWIILDLSQNELDVVEDLLPKKRGKEGSWNLKYIRKPEWNGLDFMNLVKRLKNQISYPYVLELNPKTFYPSFSIHSRIKTALKYPNYGYFGSTEVQMYNIPKDCTYTIGNNDHLEFLEGTRLICLERNLGNKMRIPGQFVSRTLEYIDRHDQVNYNGVDKFPDYLDNQEFFSDLILIIDDLRKEYQKCGKI